MTILEKIKFEEDWLSEVNLTKQNIGIAFAGIRATVLEQTRWIHVSEPPKKNGEYLVTLIDEDSNGDDIFVVDKAYWTGMNWAYKFLIVEDVIAWMPLPQPYKAESEG